MINNDKFSQLRRNFIKKSAAGIALAPLALLSSSKVSEKKKNLAHIVIVGGGFGGATVAKYLRKYDKNIKITLIEPNKIYATMPKGNCYIANIIEMKRLLQSYEVLHNKYGIEIVTDEVKKVDSNLKTLITKSGVTVNYDKLVLSIGINFNYDSLEGYSNKDINTVPHAWQTKQQLEVLYAQIQSIRDGGVFTIVPPAYPYRCPPGPYERASLVAEYFKKHKPKSKIIILDQKDDFCKQPLFEQGWKNLYGDMIEWIPASRGGKVNSFDIKNRTVITKDGSKIKTDVLNIIPPQQAGSLAFSSHLTDESGWCPVNQQTFESSISKDIYIIGDSSIAGDMPKSGHSANSQGKLCAASIILSLESNEMISPKLANTCYSLVGSDYGINVIGIYQFDGKFMSAVKGAGGISPVGKEDYFYVSEAYYAKGWHKSIVNDIWK